MTLQLSLSERIILTNQYEILSILNNTDEHRERIEALRIGYYPGYSHDEYIPNEICSSDYTKLIDILYMFTILAESYFALPDNEKLLIQPHLNVLTFKGFDSHGESGAPDGVLSYVDYEVNVRNRFTALVELRKVRGMSHNDFDSHFPVWIYYEHLHEIFRGMIDTTASLRHRFNLDELNRFIDEVKLNH